MASTPANQIGSKSVAEVRNMAVSFVGKLDSGELLTGTATVTVTPSGPTISNEVVSTAALTINGQAVAIAEAVQFKVTGGTAGQVYTFNVKCNTDSTPAQTLDGDVLLGVT